MAKYLTYTDISRRVRAKLAKVFLAKADEYDARAHAIGMPGGYIELERANVWREAAALAEADPYKNVTIESNP